MATINDFGIPNARGLSILQPLIRFRPLNRFKVEPSFSFLGYSSNKYLADACVDLYAPKKDEIGDAYFPKLNHPDKYFTLVFHVLNDTPEFDVGDFFYYVEKLCDRVYDMEIKLRIFKEIEEPIKHFVIKNCYSETYNMARYGKENPWVDMIFGYETVEEVGLEESLWWEKYSETVKKLEK